MPKPSPLASIFMFVGSALLLITIFSASWFSLDMGDDSSFSYGLVRGKECYDGHCRSRMIFSGGGMGASGLIALIVWLLSLAGIVVAVIAGCFLFKPGRSTLAVVALGLVGGGLLFALLMLVQMKFRHLSWGFPIYFVGAAGVITASIMSMMRPATPRPVFPMGMRPPMPYMNPYGPPQANPYAPPQSNPYAPPQANPYASPGAAPPRANPYAPPGMVTPAAEVAGASADPASATQGAPCQTCQTPTTWVAQYNRWFCARCQKYT